MGLFLSGRGRDRPDRKPLRALAFFSHSVLPRVTRCLTGQFGAGERLPWTYLPTYIALALPEVVLVPVLCIPLQWWGRTFGGGKFPLQNQQHISREQGARELHPRNLIVFSVA